MSMIGCFYALKEDDLEVIVSSPKRVRCLWRTPRMPDSQSFLNRLFGGKSSASVSAPEEDWQPTEKPTAFDVDKAWQGIHFLLTGSAWEGDGPLAFILCGGREIDENLGYGPAHGFTSAEVREIDAALKKVDAAMLIERADPNEFTKHEIYPEIWAHETKEECLGFVIEHFKNLKKFVGETAQSGRSLIAYIG